MTWSWAKSVAKRENPVKNSISERLSSWRRSDRQDHWRYGESSVAKKLETIEAAIGCPHLILRSDLFLEYLLLDPDRFAGEIALGDHLAVERMKRVQEPDRKRTARAETGPRRQIGVVMNFKAVVHAQVRQDSAHGGVANFGNRVHELDLGIDDPRAMLEKRRQPAQRDVTVFVNREAKHGAAMFAKPGRIIGSAAK